MMTKVELLETIQKRGYPCKIRQFESDLRACGVRPLGARQRPQRFALSAVDVLLMHRGLVPRPEQTARVPSMRELRSERRKAAA
jgi:hypothetical protein